MYNRLDFSVQFQRRSLAAKALLQIFFIRFASPVSVCLVHCLLVHPVMVVYRVHQFPPSFPRLVLQIILHLFCLLVRNYFFLSCICVLSEPSFFSDFCTFFSLPFFIFIFFFCLCDAFDCDEKFLVEGSAASSSAPSSSHSTVSTRPRLPFPYVVGSSQLAASYSSILMHSSTTGHSGIPIPISTSSTSSHVSALNHQQKEKVRQWIRKEGM